MLELLGGVSGLTDSNNGVVAVRGTEEAKRGTFQLLQPLSIVLHQLESEQEGGEDVERRGVEGEAPRRGQVQH